MEFPVLPIGFTLSSRCIGLRKTPDAGLITVRAPATSAAVFTRNSFAAAPVLLDRAHVKKSGGKTRAVLINTVSANACTGKEGAQNALRCATLVAKEVRCPVHQVLVFSTGKIGPQLPMENFEKGIPLLASESDDDVEQFAKAIMTTDLVHKIASARCDKTRLIGFAKGSGMIHPDMATMLAFVLTDARVSSSVLQKMWKDICDETFNMISVDECESTNDSALVLASNHVDVSPKALRDALKDVAQDLAIQIAKDGEGATMLMRCTVTNAKTDTEAKGIARRVIESDLLKCAMHGKDPNWGRIASAMGSLHLPIDAAKVDVRLNGHFVYKKGSPVAVDAKKVFTSSEAVIDVDLRRGTKTATAWGCDLTHEYVNINAHYTT